MARLGPWPPDRRIAVAVSGGADSMALALLAKTWGHPLALIVDHGLRPESAAEAALTAGRLAGIGVPSRILTLTGLPPGPALAARARAARHAALAAAAREAGCLDLLFAHHRRDQAETVLIRHAAGSGGAGLAGMSAVVETETIRLVRPLLGVPPGALRTLLRHHGLVWVEDPSNTNPAAERARVRARLADPAGDAPATIRLAARAARAAAARARAEHATAAWLGQHATLAPHGFAVLPPGPWPWRALSALFRTIAGVDYAPETAAVRALATAPRPTVLAGARLMPAGRLGPGFLLLREQAAMAPPVPATDGALWDGRWRLTLAAPLPPGATLGAAGPDARLLRRASTLPAAVLATLPALRIADALAYVPAIGYPDPVMCAQMATVFRPRVPLAGAAFVPPALGDAEPPDGPHLFVQEAGRDTAPRRGLLTGPAQDWME